MSNRIQNIINVKPYSITCKWANGEIRTINLEGKIREWAAPKLSVYANLLDQDVFSSVLVDPESKTLFWKGLLNMTDDKGNAYKTDLDLDPEVLYQLSEPEVAYLFNIASFINDDVQPFQGWLSGSWRCFRGFRPRLSIFNPFRVAHIQ